MSNIILDLYRGMQSTSKAAQPAVPFTPAVAVTDIGALAATNPSTPKAVSKSDLVTAVGHLNQFIASTNSSVQFAVDDKSGKVIVQVVDGETREVLRQIPNAEALSISRAMDSVQGLIIKHKV